MSDDDVLSKAEVGALLTGVADGVVATNSGVTPTGEVTAFAFNSSHNVSSYCPASLVNIYCKLSRQLQTGLYNLLRRDVEVELNGLSRHRYDEYLATLDNGVCVHTITVEPLPGTALIVLDAALVYAFVDHYFGGAGEPATLSAERNVTPAEVHMSGMLLQLILTKLTQAWSEVAEMNFVPEGFETNPAMVTVAASPESMLVAKLNINLAGTAGTSHIVMPLSMLEPVRAKLDASAQGSLRGREHFHKTMRQRLQDVSLTLQGNLCEAPLTLREMLKLSPGDVIPVDLLASIGLSVDDVPVLFGRFGRARGMNAVCLADRATNAQQKSNSHRTKS